LQGSQSQTQKLTLQKSQNFSYTQLQFDTKLTGATTHFLYINRKRHGC
jgi:hypothetical protein